MKKIFTFGCLLLMGSLAWAQINKGTILLGGSGNYGAGSLTRESVDGTIDNSYDTYSFGPSFGYFLANDLVFGADVSIGGEKLKDQDTGNEDNSSSISLGLFGRYYLNKIILEVTGGLISQTTNFISGAGGQSTSKYGGPYYSAGLGYLIFITESVAFEPMINYSGNNLTNDDIADDTQSTGLFQLKFGLNIYLAK